MNHRIIIIVIIIIPPVYVDIIGDTDTASYELMALSLIESMVQSVYKLISRLCKKMRRIFERLLSSRKKTVKKALQFRRRVQVSRLRRSRRYYQHRPQSSSRQCDVERSPNGKTWAFVSCPIAFIWFIGSLIAFMVIHDHGLHWICCCRSNSSHSQTFAQLLHEAPSNTFGLLMPLRSRFCCAPLLVLPAVKFKTILNTTIQLIIHSQHNRGHLFCVCVCVCFSH